ncbi:MAG: O-methyltransferase [Planctomycetota bacterium]|jgi:caffeoyl-CoA O-methyltransferase
MSKESTPIGAGHFDYIAGHTRGDDDFLRALKEAAGREGIPSIHIAPEQASFMQLLIKLCGARTVIEVGTLAGYSAITMARALPEGGMVHTIEIEERHTEFAERWAKQSDVAKRIRVHRGPGLEVLPRFADHSADAAFVDADKLGYAGYLDECLRILRPGGLFMADNAFAFGQLLETGEVEPGVHAIRKFNEKMARKAELHGIIVPLGDGLWVAVKNG